jgi:hypothetical protein
MNVLEVIISALKRHGWPINEVITVSEVYLFFKKLFGCKPQEYAQR